MPPSPSPDSWHDEQGCHHKWKTGKFPECYARRRKSTSRHLGTDQVYISSQYWFAMHDPWRTRLESSPKYTFYGKMLQKHTLPRLRVAKSAYQHQKPHTKGTKRKLQRLSKKSDTCIEDLTQKVHTARESFPFRASVGPIPHRRVDQIH